MKAIKIACEYVCYICAFIMFFLNNNEAACFMMLTIIYLKMPREKEPKQ